MVEWCILLLVVLTLLWVFGRHLREVQGQTEKVAVWSTLAQLRAALMVSQLTQQMRGTEAAPTEKNPFRLLQAPPPNFAGEWAMQDAERLLPGSWAFDPTCVCIGYRLIDPQWLEPAQTGDTVWFRIILTPGEVRLAPLANYLWFGKAL